MVGLIHNKEEDGGRISSGGEKYRVAPTIWPWGWSGRQKGVAGSTKGTEKIQSIGGLGRKSSWGEQTTQPDKNELSQASLRETILAKRQGTTPPRPAINRKKEKEKSSNQER